MEEIGGFEEELEAKDVAEEIDEYLDGGSARYEDEEEDDFNPKEFV